MHVAFDRGHDDLAGGGKRFETRRLFLGLQIGLQMSDGLLHDARRLDDLRQEHLARAKQVADNVHAVHQRTFYHPNGLIDFLPRLLGVLHDKFGDAVHERVRQALLDRALTPGEVRDNPLRPALTLEFGRCLQQPIGCVLAAVEDHVLAQLAQAWIDIVIERELARVDDAHVHTGLNGMIEKYRVHGRAYGLVAAEGER